MMESLEMYMEPECILNEFGTDICNTFNNECYPSKYPQLNSNCVSDEKEECKYCLEIFGKEDIARHVQTHYGQKENKCFWKNEDGSMCGKIFSRLYHLQRHYRTHDGLKIHKCDKCVRMFARKDNLKQHMATHSELHSNSKLYKCETCNKTHRTKYQLKKHLQTHPVPDSFLKEKSKCLYCLEILDKELVSTHLQTHHWKKEYKCVWTSVDGSTCEKIFSRTDHLKRHYRLHEGLQSHECPECLKTFSRKDNLKAHIRTHSEPSANVRSSNKPLFSCKMCNTSYGRKYQLEEHLQTHFVVNELSGVSVDGK